MHNFIHKCIFFSFLYFILAFSQAAPTPRLSQRIPIPASCKLHATDDSRHPYFEYFPPTYDHLNHAIVSHWNIITDIERRQVTVQQFEDGTQLILGDADARAGLVARPDLSATSAEFRVPSCGLSETTLFTTTSTFGACYDTYYVVSPIIENNLVVERIYTCRCPKGCTHLFTLHSTPSTPPLRTLAVVRSCTELVLCRDGGTCTGTDLTGGPLWTTPAPVTVDADVVVTVDNYLAVAGFVGDTAAVVVVNLSSRSQVTVALPDFGLGAWRGLAGELDETGRLVVLGAAGRWTRTGDQDLDAIVAVVVDYTNSWTYYIYEGAPGGMFSGTRPQQLVSRTPEHMARLVSPRYHSVASQMVSKAIVYDSRALSYSDRCRPCVTAFSDLASGVYRDVKGECNTCPAGYICDGLTATLCPYGTFNPFPGLSIFSDTCIVCPAEHWSSDDRTTCLTCASDEFRSNGVCYPCNSLAGASYCQPSRGANVLATCPAGWAVSSNHLTCRQCRWWQRCDGQNKEFQPPVAALVAAVAVQGAVVVLAGGVVAGRALRKCTMLTRRHGPRLLEKDL